MAGRHHTRTSSFSSTLRKRPDSPTGPKLLKWQAATGISRIVLGQISLNADVTTSWHQQRYVRELIHACCYWRLAKWSKPSQCSVLTSHYLWGHIYTPSSGVFSCICYIKTSSHLCLLQENSLSRVCFSKTSFHLCASANHHLAQLTLHRTIGFHFSLSHFLAFGLGLAPTASLFSSSRPGVNKNTGFPRHLPLYKRTLTPGRAQDSLGLLMQEKGTCRTLIYKLLCPTPVPPKCVCVSGGRSYMWAGKSSCSASFHCVALPPALVYRWTLTHASKPIPHVPFSLPGLPPPIPACKASAGMSCFQVLCPGCVSGTGMELPLLVRKTLEPWVSVVNEQTNDL